MESARPEKRPVRSILTCNGGSSSIKFALFAEDSLDRSFWGKVDRIGSAEASLEARGVGGFEERRPIASDSVQAAAVELLTYLTEKKVLSNVTAVGHRVVHGGPRFTQSQMINRDVVAALRELADFDPEHLPTEIALIEEIAERRPEVPQIACFDTSFHQHLPQIARLLPIPRRYAAKGIRRYGFHGISYAYLMEELGRAGAPGADKGRIVLAHLGSGASMAAVKDGVSIDTSMSFTPTAGLMMGSRSGDLDPGLFSYLARTEKMTTAGFQDMVHFRSGLLGVSETSSDMRDLLAREAEDSRAAEAVEMFCYQAKKWVGSFAAALGGIDTFVFSGGIGENASPVRARICKGLEFLGLHLDESRNALDAAVISGDGSPATIRVIPTDEETMIAKTVLRLTPTQI